MQTIILLFLAVQPQEAVFINDSRTAVAYMYIIPCLVYRSSRWSVLHPKPAIRVALFIMSYMYIMCYIRHKVKLVPGVFSIQCWRHQMETYSALLVICARNSPATGECPAQSPVTWSFDISFDLRLIKRPSKQSRGWWFDTQSRPLWRHCNAKLAERVFQWHTTIPASLNTYAQYTIV